MEKHVNSLTVEDILNTLAERGQCAVSVKSESGAYTYANEGWSELAAAPVHKIIGRRDRELPWGFHNALFIQTMDSSTRRDGRLKRVDRRVHFQKKMWLHTITERFYVPTEQAIVCAVSVTDTDEFCLLANLLTEKGITYNGYSLSVRQLYLLHQMLFHVPHEQTARELDCSAFRIHQHLREIREHFAVNDNGALLRALSSNGFLPLLERFDSLFRQQWIPTELKFHQGG